MKLEKVEKECNNMKKTECMKEKHSCPNEHESELRSEIKSILKYQAVFLLFIVYMELVFALSTSKDWSLKSLWMFIFFPAVSLFLAACSGFKSEIVSRIISPAILLLIGVFYASQLIYYNIFGSLWSFSMVKMGGNAATNFTSAIFLEIRDNIFILLLLFAPFILSVVLPIKALQFKTKIKFGKYNMWLRLAGFVLSVLLWLLGSQALRLGGTGTNSAYYVYASTLSDTDTTSNCFGTFATTLIEMKSMVLGNDGNDASEKIETAIENIDEIFSDIESITDLLPDLESGMSDIFVNNGNGDLHSGNNDITDNMTGVGNAGNSENDLSAQNGFGTANGGNPGNAGNSGDAGYSGNTGNEGNKTGSVNKEGNGNADKVNNPAYSGYASSENSDNYANNNQNLSEAEKDSVWAFDIDFDAIAAECDDEDVKNLCQYFQNVEPSRKNKYTGLFEGYNLIYICAESFWTYAVNQYLTPTLYKMMNGGIILENYYGSFLNTTTNGEFAMATGLWPDVGREGTLNGSDVGSFPKSADKAMPFGLGNLFEREGVNSYAFHNYKGSYYARNKSWPNLGYQCKFMTCKNEPFGGMEFSSSWITSDLEMMQQSVDDYINEDRFHAYYMTFSGHGPYNEKNENAIRNMSEAKRINEEQELGYEEEALAYIAANMELDKAMEYLLERLAEKGVADKTVIVLAADHYPYYVLGSHGRELLTGKEIGNNDVERYKSTCMIYNSAIVTPIVNDEFCCNVDILPTILNLFNIDFDSRLLSGKDVFADNVIHKAVLYNKSFLTEYVTYNTQTTTEWHVDVNRLGEERMEKYLSSMSALIESEYAVALKIMECDFFRYIGCIDE